MSKYVYLILASAAVLFVSGCPSGPTAAFSAAERYGVAPLVVQFTDSSDANGADITAWAWDFGDAGTSTEQNPSHSFATTGSYTVSLTVTNADGSDTVSKTDYVVVGNMWTQTVGTSGNEEGYAVALTSYAGHVGYLVAGSTDSGDGHLDAYVAKLDLYGNLVWDYSYGEAGGDEVAESIVALDDGNILVAGTTTSYGPAGENVYLLMLNYDGVEQWHQAYGGTGRDRGLVVRVANDEGFIIGGDTTSAGSEGGDMYLVKTDSEGTKEWTAMVHGPGSETVRDLKVLDDGYLLVGDTQELGAVGTNMYVVKTDTSGTASWALEYGDTGTDKAYSVASTSDGGYLVVGESDSGMAMRALKISSTGTLTWAKSYGGNKVEKGYAVVPASGGFLIAGITTSFGAGSKDVYLVKIDTSGEKLWGRVYGGTGNDTAYGAIVAYTNGFVTVGTTDSFGAGGTDMYVVRTNADGHAPGEE